jgi:hypothetical protein
MVLNTYKVGRLLTDGYGPFGQCEHIATVKKTVLSDNAAAGARTPSIIGVDGSGGRCGLSL